MLKNDLVEGGKGGGEEEGSKRMFWDGQVEKPAF